MDEQQWETFVLACSLTIRIRWILKVNVLVKVRYMLNNFKVAI